MLLEYVHPLALDAGYELDDLATELRATHELRVLRQDGEAAYQIEQLRPEQVATLVAVPRAHSFPE